MRSLTSYISSWGCVIWRNKVCIDINSILPTTLYTSTTFSTPPVYFIAMIGGTTTSKTTYDQYVRVPPLRPLDVRARRCTTVVHTGDRFWGRVHRIWTKQCAKNNVYLSFQTYSVRCDTSLSCLLINTRGRSWISLANYPLRQVLYERLIEQFNTNTLHTRYIHIITRYITLLHNHVLSAYILSCINNTSRICNPYLTQSWH